MISSCDASTSAQAGEAARAEGVDVRCPRCEQLFRDVTPELAADIVKNFCAVCRVPMRREGE